MSNDPNWTETQSKLLADIEAFARTNPDLAAVNAAEKQPPKPSAAPAMQPAPAARQAAPVSQPAPTAPAAAAPTASGSLLERLKREAEAKRMTDSQVLATQGQTQRGISDALQTTFQYLRELCEQINVLKPPYPLPYVLSGNVKFENLAWQEGRADFRMVPDAKEERLMQQVTLRFRLAAAGQLRVERENPAHESFRAALIDANIAYTEEEFRNQKSHVERAVYTFPVEVKAGLGFTADYQAGDIRLLVRNVRRFGAAEYRLPFEALNQEAFEEIGQLVLGEESRIEKMFRRVA